MNPKSVLIGGNIYTVGDAVMFVKSDYYATSGDVVFIENIDTSKFTASFTFVGKKYNYGSDYFKKLSAVELAKLRVKNALP